MFGLIGWIIFGLIVGVIAKLVMPGDDPGGIIITALLGIALITDLRAATFGAAVLLAVGAAAALAVLLLCFAALYARLQQADVPAAFREAPLALVTAGIMALAFMGFSRLIQE